MAQVQHFTYRAPDGTIKRVEAASIEDARSTVGTGNYDPQGYKVRENNQPVGYTDFKLEEEGWFEPSQMWDQAQLTAKGYDVNTLQSNAAKVQSGAMTQEQSNAANRTQEANIAEQQRLASIIPPMQKRSASRGLSPGIQSEVINGERYEIGSKAWQAAKAQRLPGESVADFTSRIDSQSRSGSLSRQATIGTSTALRMKDRAQELKAAFGLGNAPVMPDIFGSTDQRSLNLARQERDAINRELEGILAERLAIDAEFRKFSQNAGEGTTEAGRAGITSEEGRKVQEQYDALNRRELVLETKLNNRNSVIKELMSSQQQEYAMAVDQYNTRFSQAMQLYDIFDREEQRDYDRQMDERDDLRANAKANLEVLSGAIQAQIEAGTLSEINAVQRAQLQDLETQAGLPLGSTLAVLQTMKPGEEKLWAGVDDFGGFSYITKTPNGEIKVYKSANAVPQDSGESESEDSKIITKFNADLATPNLLKVAGTREQFIRQLQAKYPEIDPSDIATAVYSTYPDGYEKMFSTGRSL